MSSSADGPDDPTSSLSKLARKAAFITGGGGKRGGPSTWTAFMRLARERSQIPEAERAWDRRRDEALRAHAARWGQSGLAGWLDKGPRPRGAALLAWYRDSGGGVRVGTSSPAHAARQQEQLPSGTRGAGGDGGQAAAVVSAGQPVGGEMAEASHPLAGGDDDAESLEPPLAREPDGRSNGGGGDQSFQER